tara:strand:+ start:7002 stop:7166 length:165 start_codon:yes stop_codon:yes gene_type:complete
MTFENGFKRYQYYISNGLQSEAEAVLARYPEIGEKAEEAQEEEAPAKTKKKKKK